MINLLDQLNSLYFLIVLNKENEAILLEIGDHKCYADAQRNNGETVANPPELVVLHVV